MTTLVPAISSSLSEDVGGQEYVSEMMNVLTKEENISLFIKLAKNQLTVADQQAIIDIMFSNETFREYTKSSLENVRASGKRLGRPFAAQSKKLKLAKNTKKIKDLWDKKVSIAQIARSVGVQRMTVYRFIQRMGWDI